MHFVSILILFDVFVTNEAAVLGYGYFDVKYP